MRTFFGPTIVALALAAAFLTAWQGIVTHHDRQQRTAEQEALDRIAFSKRHAPGNPCGGLDRCRIVEAGR